MLVGPFDRRKKRSRCQSCSASHLKCSGQLPCTHCERRRVECTYPDAQAASTPFILVERGRQQTVANWKPPRKQRQRNQALLSSSSSSSTSSAIAAASLASSRPLKDDRIRYLHFFDLFVQCNSFNGKGQSFADEIKQLPGFQAAENSHMMDAMMSLGALQAVKLGSPDAAVRKATLERALEYYSKSIVGLRDALDNQKEGQPAHLRNSVLWSTLFLGLFELTNDATGHGWRQHIIYGTSKALEASGPAACRTGASRRFFMQARVFEICRTISFNEPTFLTRPEWLRMSRDMWTGEGAEDWRPLDSLLDVMVMCSNLRVRAAKFIEEQEASPDAGPTPTSRAISMDGFALREALDGWYASYAQSSPKSPTSQADVPAHLSSSKPPSNSDSSNSSSNSPSISSPKDEADDMFLARVFFAAISIYLSGVYDYEIIHWQRAGLATPVLSEATVQMHVRTILTLTEAALDQTTLSPLLFTFPLRIAGARARRQAQRDCILGLIDRIRSGFAVAGAILGDLAKVWMVFPVISDEKGLDEVEPVPPLTTSLDG